MIFFTKWIVISFGLYLIIAGFFMLFKPLMVQRTIAKAGSTPLINYAEISLRCVPAIALIIYASYSKFPEVFKYVGWFMFATSIILFVVPIKTHHSFSLKASIILKPLYLKLISPFAMGIGIWLLYAV